nr:uncharacterized protein LOC129045313 [Pongo pygmaeus]
MLDSVRNTQVSAPGMGKSSFPATPGVAEMFFLNIPMENTSVPRENAPALVNTDCLSCGTTTRSFCRQKSSLPDMQSTLTSDPRAPQGHMPAQSQGPSYDSGLEETPTDSRSTT